MKALRTHAVETDEADPAPAALCGLLLISQFAWMMGPFASMSQGDLPWDDYVKLRRKVRVYADGDRPWYTVEEYAEGEEGCDDIDCRTCRRRLQGALDRYWGGPC